MNTCFKQFSFPFFIDYLTLVDYRDDLTEHCLESCSYEKLNINYPELRNPIVSESYIKGNEDLLLKIFLPEGLTITCNDEECKDRIFLAAEKSIDLRVIQKRANSNNYTRFAFPSVALSEKKLELIISLGDIATGKMDLPVYHYMHPLAGNYIKPFLWFSFTKKQILKEALSLKTPWPIWEKYKNHYMCRGIFFPTLG